MPTAKFKTLYHIDLGHPLNDYYVLAMDPTAAYKELRNALDDADYGFAIDRNLKHLDVVAVEIKYIGDGHNLII